MQKERLVVSNLALSEISLIILSIFAFAFIIGESNLVSGQIGVPNPAFLGTKTSGAAVSTAGNIGTDAATEVSTGKAAGALFEGLLWAGIAYLAGQILGDLLGLEDGVGDAISAGLAAGAFTYSIAAEFATGGAAQSTFNVLGTSIVSGPFLIGLAVAAIVAVVLWEEEKYEIVSFECLPWEAPLGGNDCERCNDDPLRPCTEYRCRSLGQACELVNKGTTQEMCTWVSRNDVLAPTITPAEDVLTSGHAYTNHNTLPPSLGAKIVKNGAPNGCIQAFTPLEFGITLNEPGQCKIDYNHTSNYDDMLFFFGDSNFYQYNHTQKLSLPSPAALAEIASPMLQNDGIYNLYVRCRDANGNTNEQEYVFNFCVDPSPDTTPPVVESSSILSGSPVTFGSDEINVDFYINEPAECKWSVQDKNYDDMENSMSCASSVLEINALSLYSCSTTLTGIENNKDNTFFVRCKDQPGKPDNERNVNMESYEFLLKGTQPLNIIDYGPENETITGSTNTVQVELTVETSNGAEEGKAACFFSPTGQEDSYIAMFETNSHLHKQVLSLTTGTYTYHFRCVDAGGNSDSTVTTFDVLVDKAPPLIAKVYKEGPDAVKIVTDEEAECTYSLNSCNYVFDEGIKALKVPGVKNVNLVEWKPNSVYYLKCRDTFGNEPNPNECSMIVSATNIKPQGNTLI